MQYPAHLKKKHKYNACKIVVDDKMFDSKKEATRYIKLKIARHGGVISNLELQPVFILQEKFKHRGKTIRAIKYIADFRYQKNGVDIVEDVKGMRTPVYGLKKKMFLKKYPDIEFREI